MVFKGLIGIEGFDFTASCIYLKLMLLSYINLLVQ